MHFASWQYAVLYFQNCLLFCNLQDNRLISCNSQDNNLLSSNLQDSSSLSCILHYRSFPLCSWQDCNLLSCSLQDNNFLWCSLQDRNILSHNLHHTSYLLCNLHDSNFQSCSLQAFYCAMFKIVEFHINFSSWNMSDSNFLLCNSEDSTLPSRNLYDSSSLSWSLQGHTENKRHGTRGQDLQRRGGISLRGLFLPHAHHYFGINPLCITWNNNLLLRKNFLMGKA